MPDFRKGGVKAVHYSSDGQTDNWTGIDSDVTRVDGLNPEPVNQETTSGDYQSGETSSPTFYFDDHTDYSTLRNLAVGSNRARQFFAVEFWDGTILKTKRGVYPKCWLVPKAQSSEGESEWALSWNESLEEAFEKIASLTS